MFFLANSLDYMSQMEEKPVMEYVQENHEEVWMWIKGVQEEIHTQFGLKPAKV